MEGGGGDGITCNDTKSLILVIIRHRSPFYVVSVQDFYVGNFKQDFICKG